MKGRIVIADDEQHICEELKYILQQEKSVKIISVCSTGDEALKAIVKFKPDIVFLDIAMPGIDGISLGHYLKNTKKPPYIIYLTAYDQYAIEAIKVGAKAYVLKPFSDEDIKENLRLALEYLREKNDFNLLQTHANPFMRICGILNGRLILIDQQEILMAYAKDREVFLRSNGIDYLSKLSLSELESKLDSSIFFRCHRNYIVNLYKIKQVAPWFNGTYLLTMNDKNKTEVPISRNKVKAIKEMIGI